MTRFWLVGRGRRFVVITDGAEAARLKNEGIYRISGPFVPEAVRP